MIQVDHITQARKTQNGENGSDVCLILAVPAFIGSVEECHTRCNACRRNLITGLTSAASPRVHISNTCKVGQKFGVSLPLLTCSPSA
jgi:hypothetical protein